MKKLITLAVLATLTSLGLKAQDNFEIGIRAGANLSTIRGEGSGSDQGFWDSEDTRSTGFTGGLYTRFGNKFFVQPELIVSQKGGTTTGLLGVERDFKQTYFDIPVLLGVKATDVVRFNAGPVATFLINEDNTFLENIGITQAEEGFRKALLGYQVGVGFDIRSIRLDMRYEGNVNDVFNIDYDDQQTENQFSGKGNSFSITAGYAF
ncbi:porin family protein [Jiulongibacter sediminis]|jgi:opacity protein-like surface antigen|uniref:porin family protein n=1 Tax=Jiulongibacter sediminis TaxID=1605367 RepID=UPI0026EB887E|nr:porin family protein [Jiulongibacter sediminis]